MKKDKSSKSFWFMAIATALLFYPAAQFGIRTGWERLPQHFRKGHEIAPSGTRVKIVTATAASSPKQRDLIDFLFAKANGIHLEDLVKAGRILFLAQESEGIVQKSDLDFLLIRPDDGQVPLWIQAEAVGLDPKQGSGKGR